MILNLIHFSHINGVYFKATNLSLKVWTSVHEKERDYVVLKITISNCKQMTKDNKPLYQPWPIPNPHLPE